MILSGFNLNCVPYQNPRLKGGQSLKMQFGLPQKWQSYWHVRSHVAKTQ